MITFTLVKHAEPPFNEGGPWYKGKHISDTLLMRHCAGKDDEFMDCFHERCLSAARYVAAAHDWHIYVEGVDPKPN